MINPDHPSIGASLDGVVSWTVVARDVLKLSALTVTDINKTL